MQQMCEKTAVTSIEWEISVSDQIIKLYSNLLIISFFMSGKKIALFWSCYLALQMLWMLPLSRYRPYYSF